MLLTSLLTFGDYSDQLRSKSADATIIPNASPAAPVAPPPPPPKPEGHVVDQIAILQAKEQVSFFLIVTFNPIIQSVYIHSVM